MKNVVDFIFKACCNTSSENGRGKLSDLTVFLHGTGVDKFI
jgi:hypothetical protein